MTESAWADGPGYLARYGGPQRVAEVLMELGYGNGYLVTRQAVYSLWKHRHGNGFPDRVRVEVPNGWRQLFDLDEVKAWLDNPERAVHTAIDVAVKEDQLTDTTGRDENDGES